MDAFMFSLIVIAFLTIGVGFFATQNTGALSLNFGYKILEGVPIYIAVLSPLFIGLIAAWLTNIQKDIATAATRKQLKKDLEESKKEVYELTKRVHKLEIENTKLKAETGKPFDEDSL